MRGDTSEGWALACSGSALEVDYEVRGEEGRFPQHGAFDHCCSLGRANSGQVLSVLEWTP